MHFKRHMELEHGLRQIDIAPLVNIFFLLFIFFMLVSSFVAQPAVKINLPKAVTSDVVRSQNIEITVTGENLVYLDGRQVSNKELEAFLSQLKGKNTSVLIKSDKRASLGRVVEVWDLCRNLGIAQLNLATNQQ